jgi:ankyrin repeat protein
MHDSINTLNLLISRVAVEDIFAAALNNQADVVKLLVRDYVVAHGQTVLHHLPYITEDGDSGAGALGYQAAVDLVAGECAQQVYSKDFSDNTPLLLAVFRDNACCVRTYRRLVGDAPVDAGRRGSLLHCASSVEIARILLDAGDDINARNCFGETPLIFLALAHEPDPTLAPFLLSRGADVHAVDNSGVDAFGNALAMRYTQLMTLLIEHGVDVTTAGVQDAYVDSETDVRVSKPHYTALMLASAAGEIEAVRVLLRAPQATVEWVNAEREGETALTAAVCNNHLPVIQALVGAGADANLRMADGRVPLHFAREADTAQALLKAGARDAECDRVLAGRTTTHYSALLGACYLRQEVVAEVELVEVLLEFPEAMVAHPADSPVLYPPLRHAVAAVHYGDCWAERGDIGLLQKLLSADIPMRLNHRAAEDGATALLLAAQLGKFGAVSTLLQHGADPRVADNEGLTPLMVAKSRLDVRPLVDAAPDTVNMRDLRGETVLMKYCARDRRAEWVEELLAAARDQGVLLDLDARTRGGYTALQMALMRSDHKTARQLLRMGASVLDGGDAPAAVPTVLMPFLYTGATRSACRKREDALMNQILRQLISSLTCALGLEEVDEDEDEPVAKRRRQ